MPNVHFTMLLALIRLDGRGRKMDIVAVAGYGQRYVERELRILLALGWVEKSLYPTYAITERGKIAASIESGRRTKQGWLRMNKKVPDFKSIEERDKYFRDNADYFTLVAKEGVGHYERTEYPKLAAAQKAGHTKATISGGGWMIYAVIGQQSAFVEAIKPKG